VAKATPYADSARFIGFGIEGDHDDHQHQQRRQTKESKFHQLSDHQDFGELDLPLAKFVALS
jgi:hypothetical protein